jgi:hypothetical protein
MKRADNIQVRGTPEELGAFRDACARQGVHVSAVIRDLCAAAIPYMAEHCKPGRWISPSLVPYGACEKAAEVVQVHNGKGHQKASVKKRG